MPQKKNSGFTLLEFLISFAILLIISGTVVVFLRDFFSLGTMFETSFLIEREIESSLKNIINELREATQSSVGGYALEKAEPNSLAFYTNIDSDSLEERVHYFLNGTNLMKSVVKPIGQPLTYSTTTATESLRVLLRDIDVSTSSPLFLYRGPFSTSTPATSTLYIQDIRLVNVRFTVDKDPRTPPAAISVSSVVSIRNLKTY